MSIDLLFEDETKIPSLPDIFYQFKKAVEDPNKSFDYIAEIVGHDTGLTARLLKIVNSAFFGFSSQVETISHATSIIGISQLNDLILSTVVMGCFKDIPPETINMESFWKHSVACALASKALAIEMESPNSEKVFISGLLHDIGRLIISLKAPKESLKIFSLMKDQGFELHLAEKQVLGFNHCEIGARLLNEWGLPNIHQEITAYHHTPNKASSFPVECAIVHCADILVNSLELGTSGETIIPEFDEEASKRTNIQDESFRSLLVDEVKEKFDETFQLFFQST
jgi:putative nucleotidyltransferase with HDIG domain